MCGGGGTEQDLPWGNANLSDLRTWSGKLLTEWLGGGGGMQQLLELQGCGCEGAFLRLKRGGCANVPVSASLPWPLQSSGWRVPWVKFLT